MTCPERVYDDERRAARGRLLGLALSFLSAALVVAGIIWWLSW
jgi:hypothetical protein